MKTPKYLHTKKKNKLYQGKVDLCPVCEEDLYYDEVTSQRIGVLEKDGSIESWKCPFCYSEFDLDNNILYIYGSEIEGGEA